MNAHLTGYFWTYRCVYLLDSACKRIFVIITQLVRYSSSNLLYFFTYVFKIAFVLFCFVSESVRLLLASTSSELRLYIYVLETVIVDFR